MTPLSRQSHLRLLQSGRCRRECDCARLARSHVLVSTSPWSGIDCTRLPSLRHDRGRCVDLAAISGGCSGPHIIDQDDQNVRGVVGQASLFNTLFVRRTFDRHTSAWGPDGVVGNGSTSWASASENACREKLIPSVRVIPRQNQFIFIFNVRIVFSNAVAIEASTDAEPDRL